MSITKLYLTTYPNRPNGSGENRAIPGHGRAKPSPVFISARRGLRARAVLEIINRITVLDCMYVCR